MGGQFSGEKGVSFQAISTPFHLRYLFAGTTAKGRASDIGLLKDIARVRPGDPVLFYLMNVGFFGVFKIASAAVSPLWEPVEGWLQEELVKPLIYRVRIEPDEVYAQGVSEWDAVDDLPMYARDVRWSLLYRKMKGERGCSYLFEHEFESLRALLGRANPGGPLVLGPTDSLTWGEGQIALDVGSTYSFK